MQKCHLQDKLFLSACVCVCVCVCVHIKTWNCVNYPSYTVKEMVQVKN